jgi:hypothetical protein
MSTHVAKIVHAKPFVFRNGMRSPLPVLFWETSLIFTKPLVFAHNEPQRCCNNESPHLVACKWCCDQRRRGGRQRSWWRIDILSIYCRLSLLTPDYILTRSTGCGFMTDLKQYQAQKNRWENHVAALKKNLKQHYRPIWNVLYTYTCPCSCLMPLLLGILSFGQDGFVLRRRQTAWQAFNHAQRGQIILAN